jgi:DNA segregation ATPase FtsK/SpoIIIE, S-DNA-T family
MAVEMTRRRLLEVVQRLGSQARMAGIHLVLSTQRTDKTTLPEELKDHLYGRVALRVQDASASRVLLNQAGAESLLGQSDLLANLGHGLVRAQAPIA